MSKRSMEPESIPSASTTVSEWEGQQLENSVLDASMPPEMTSAALNSFWFSLYTTEAVTSTPNSPQQLIQRQCTTVDDSPKLGDTTILSNVVQHREAVKDWLSLEWVEDI